MADIILRIAASICSRRIRFYSHGSGSNRDSSGQIPDGERVHEAVTYDEAGRVLSETNPEGHMMSYAWDGVGRMVERRLTPASGGEDRVRVTMGVWAKRAFRSAATAA